MLHANYNLFYFSLYKINNSDLTESCCKKVVDNCNAKCFLDEKMNDESSNSKNSNTNDLKLKISECVINYSDLIFNPDNIKKYYPNDGFGISETDLSDIEHPPRI